MPSKSQQVTAQCPKCDLDFCFTKWDKISASDDPHLKQQILDGSLFYVTCPSCGWTMNLSQDLRYTDLDKGYYIYLFPARAGELPEDMKNILDVMENGGIPTHVVDSPAALSSLIEAYEEDELP